MIEGGYLVSHTSYLAVYPSRDLGPAIMHSGPAIRNAVSVDPVSKLARSRPRRPCYTVRSWQPRFRYSEQFDLGADSVHSGPQSRVSIRILGIDVPLTVIEWSDDTAAISLHKQSMGLKAVRDAYVGDPRFCENLQGRRLPCLHWRDREYRIHDCGAPHVRGDERRPQRQSTCNNIWTCNKLRSAARTVAIKLTIGPSPNAADRHLPVLDGLRDLPPILSSSLAPDQHRSRPGERASAGFSAGQIGVMLFFVLSGFLMGSLYLNRPLNRTNVWHFAVRRFARVIPLYYSVLTAALALAGLSHCGLIAT